MPFLLLFFSSCDSETKDGKVEMGLTRNQLHDAKFICSKERKKKDHPNLHFNTLLNILSQFYILNFVCS